MTLRRMTVRADRRFDTAPLPYAENEPGFDLSLTITVWDRSRRHLFRVRKPLSAIVVTDEDGEQLIGGDPSDGTFRPWATNSSSPRDFIRPAELRLAGQARDRASSDSFEARFTMDRPPQRLERIEGTLIVEVAEKETEVILPAAPSEEMKPVAPGLRARVLTVQPQRQPGTFYHFEFVTDHAQGDEPPELPTLGSIELLDGNGQVIGRARSLSEETIGNRTRTTCDLELAPPYSVPENARFRLRVITATRPVELPIRWGPIEVARIAPPPGPSRQRE